MSKAVASLTVAFMLGAGSLALFGSVLGVYAEAASLGLVGLGLVASSQALSMKRAGSAEPAAQMESSRAA